MLILIFVGIGIAIGLVSVLEWDRHIGIVGTRKNTYPGTKEFVYVACRFSFHSVMYITHSLHLLICAGVRVLAHRVAWGRNDEHEWCDT